MQLNFQKRKNYDHYHNQNKNQTVSFDITSDSKDKISIDNTLNLIHNKLNHLENRLNEKNNNVNVENKTHTDSNSDNDMTLFNIEKKINTMECDIYNLKQIISEMKINIENNKYCKEENERNINNCILPNDEQLKIMIDSVLDDNFDSKSNGMYVPVYDISYNSFIK